MGRAAGVARRSRDRDDGQPAQRGSAGDRGGGRRGQARDRRRPPRGDRAGARRRAGRRRRRASPGKGADTEMEVAGRQRARSTTGRLRARSSADDPARARRASSRSGRLIARPWADAVTGMQVDSRRIEEGDLFVAVGGGADFVEHALARGASAALVPEDGFAALGAIAGAVRARSSARVVGITGSTGKTSTKDILFALCAPHRRTVANEGNYNTEVGVPLTICRIEPDTEICISEMGMRGPGQIAWLASFVKPDVGGHHEHRAGAPRVPRLAGEHRRGEGRADRRAAARRSCGGAARAAARAAPAAARHHDRPRRPRRATAVRDVLHLAPPAREHAPRGCRRTPARSPAARTASCTSSSRSIARRSGRFPATACS